MEGETISPGGEELNATIIMDPSTTPGKFFLTKKKTNLFLKLSKAQCLKSLKK